MIPKSFCTGKKKAILVYQPVSVTCLRLMLRLRKAHAADLGSAAD